MAFSVRASCFFQAEDGIRAAHYCLEFRRVLFLSNEAEGPLVISRGEGLRVFDENGKEYIEALAGLWCAGLGFSEKRLVQAATRQREEDRKSVEQGECGSEGVDRGGCRVMKEKRQERELVKPEMIT